MTKLNKYLKEVEERLNAATEGPWQDCNGDEFAGSTIEGISSQHKADIIVNCGLYGDYKSGVITKNDSKFIANSRTDVEVLLKIIEELKGQRNEAIVEASYRDYDNCEDMHILDADLELESIIPQTEGGEK